MDSEQIKQLLEKYWSCETSLEEEKILKGFFKKGNVPDEFKQSASLFAYFDQQKQQNLNDVAFDAHVKHKLQPKENNMRSLFQTGLRFAAGISVVIASVWLVKSQIRDSVPQEVVDTYEDPKQAFEETKKALQMISKNFGRAQKATSKINLLNEATDKIQTQEADKVDS